MSSPAELLNSIQEAPNGLTMGALLTLHPDLARRTAQRSDVQAIIIDELRRLHDGVLARYGLRPSELAKWEAHR